MLKLYKIKHYLQKNKLAHIIITLIFTSGFIFGAIYVNMITSSDFSKSAEALRLYIEGSSSFKYNYNDEIILAGIFLGSFFLFGKWIITFFIFRYGFLTGYLCAFLIKAYNADGIFPCLIYLLLNLLMIFPFIVFLGQLGFDISSCLFRCMLKKHTPAPDFGKSIAIYIIIFLFSLIAVTFFSRIKMNIFLNTF